MRHHIVAAACIALALTSLPGCSSDDGDGGERATSAATVRNGGNEGGGGLSSQYFCPDALVPRKDMARYLERIKRGRDFAPAAARNVFGDVERDSVDAAWIEQLYADGITRGTAPGRFSPNDTVPREQMAAFIVRLFHGPDFKRGGPSRFTDVTNPDFVGVIEQLADDGITKGCTATEFCPQQMVPRDQMAAFLMRAAHPRSPDPEASGRFADVPRGRVLAGRVEQAVAEGIMEPCGTTFAGRPVVAFGVGDYAVDHPAPTIDNFLGWIPTTPNYGYYVHARKKRYFNDGHRAYCGGDYTVTAALDIGEVTHDGVFVKSITFYAEGVSPVVHQDHVWVGTNRHIEKYTQWTDGITEAGTAYLHYRINTWFPGGQGRNGDALQIQHTMISEPAEIWGGSLVDNPDGGYCSMILRGALSTY